MVAKMDIESIEEIEDEQIRLNENMPFKVKYQKDYLWQIYYSEYTNQYFMLVTTEDLEYSAFFYILKKQLEKSEEKIYIPINYIDYSGEYLSRLQISDIENYLWFFTKEWPLVYEVYDKEENLSLQIVGQTYIYDDIQSDYKIVLRSKEEAIKLYKLLKALFIMKTELPHYYNITVLINDNASLEFAINDRKVIYEILSSIVKEEYLKAEDIKIKITEEKTNKEKELNNLQKKCEKLEKEYLEKEKQIAIFLEYKKTFFGKVKYFFKYKKVNLSKKKEVTEKEQEVKVIRLTKFADVKTNYTLEELIELYKKADKEEVKLKNLKLDIKALEKRIENLESKVKNATQYIEEIDEHKKSIFEFWKFTNKDKSAELPAGKEQTEKKLKKYAEDFLNAYNKRNYGAAHNLYLVALNVSTFMKLNESFMENLFGYSADDGEDEDNPNLGLFPRDIVREVDNICCTKRNEAYGDQVMRRRGQEVDYYKHKKTPLR